MGGDRKHRGGLLERCAHRWWSGSRERNPQCDGVIRDESRSNHSFPPHRSFPFWLPSLELSSKLASPVSLEVQLL
jgi:hypothetical protein